VAAVFGEDAHEIHEKVLDAELTRSDWELLGAIEPNATLSVRIATEAEKLRWHQTVAAAVGQGELHDIGEAQEDNHVAFLVPLSDPDEDEPDDDED
jgi:hypothetical protein